MEENKNPNISRPSMPPRPMPARPIPARPPIQKPDIKHQTMVEKQTPEQVKPGKVKKHKKEKIKKEKKTLSKKAKVIIALSFVGFIILSSAITGLVFYLKEISPLSTPNNLQITTISEYIFAECDKVNKAEVYEFTVKFNDDKYYVISSDIPKVDLTNYIKDVGDYQIQVRAVGKNKKSASKYKTENYKHIKKLNVPTIYYNSETETISFTPVKNTTLYHIYYSFIDYKVIEHNTLDEIEYSLSEIFDENGAGYFNFKVKAISSDENYSDSNFSNEIVALNKIQLDPVSTESINYDKINKKITFISQYQNFEISIKIQGISEQRVIKLKYSETNQNKTVDLNTKSDLISSDEKVIQISIIVLGNDFEINSVPAIKDIE